MDQRYFWAEKEINMIQQQGQQILLKNSNYKEKMTNFLLSGLKALGYDKSFEMLEQESNQIINKKFPTEFKTYLLNKQFDQAIGFLNLKDDQNYFNENQKTFLQYEILKLKFINAILNRDVIIALFLLRNELCKYPQFFEQEKQNFAKMYLMKTKQEVIDVIGFDMTNQDSYIYKIFQIEFKTLLEDVELVEDPFITIFKNNLCYQFINCKYHKQQMFRGHNDFPVSKNLQHNCLLEYIPESITQELEKVFCEIWKVKVSEDGLTIIASGSSQMFCWIYDQRNDSYKLTWQNPVYEEEDILDWDVVYSKNIIICSVNFKIIVFLDLLKGTELKIVKDLHKDIIKAIYVYKNVDQFITGSIDGSLVIRQIDNPEKTLYEIKTNRIVNLVVSHSETFAFTLHGDLKALSLISLQKFSCQNFLIEKDQINSMAISNDDTLLLINTGREVPELHLWSINQKIILNYFRGHQQSNFIIQCGFFTREIIFCGSEDGKLIFWHTNQQEPVKSLQLSLNSINDAKIFQHPITKKIQAITASDNSIITIIQQIIFI